MEFEYEGEYKSAVGNILSYKLAIYWKSNTLPPSYPSTCKG